MLGVSKTVPPNRVILKDIYLSFFYGAKIGIIGSNGSGKSTLMRLIAGIDDNYQGKIEFSRDYTVGMLEQEPKLDPDKTVIELVREGKKEILDMLDEYNAITEKFSDPKADQDKLMERMGTLQDKIDAADAWEIDNVLQPLFLQGCTLQDGNLKPPAFGSQRLTDSILQATRLKEHWVIE